LGLANAVLRGKFIAMSAFIKKSERSQINNLTMHPNILEKYVQGKFKAVDGKKYKEQGRNLKWRPKEQCKKINEISLFFEKINKIDKLLAKLAKTKRKRTQINKIKDEKGEYHNKHQ
jgi:MFS superfamily sulfate permease-like transporter